MSKKIIALIPAHNEGRMISKIVSGASEFLPVLVIDDGSSDDTAVQAEKAGAMVIRQIPNQGKGRALCTGFKQAIELGAEAVITLDGDGQHDPAEIPHFLTEHGKNPQGLIIGCRDFQRMPLSRRLANSFGRVMLSLAVGQDILDNQSGYRLVSRELMSLMLQSSEQGFEFEVDMVVLAIKHHLGIAWVPIRTIYTGGASHIRPINHIVNFFRITLKAYQKMHAR